MSKSDSATPTVKRAQMAIIGRRSEQQDDSRFVDDVVAGANATLMILADGMGGATGGALASRLAVEAAAASFGASRGDVPARLQSALHAGNKAIADAVDADPALEGMGTTMILALVTGRTVTWTSVGDSLLFGVRAGRLERINADHSLAAVLDQAAAEGKISAEEAASSPQRNMLRSALTGGTIALIDTGERTLAPSTRLVAASDGVLTLPFERIVTLIDGAADVRAGLGEVIAAVEADMPHDQDNLTLLAVQIRASSGKAARRVSPWLVGLLALGLLTVIGAVAAVIILSASPGDERRLAAPLSPAGNSGAANDSGADPDAPVETYPADGRSTLRPPARSGDPLQRAFGKTPPTPPKPAASAPSKPEPKASSSPAAKSPPPAAKPTPAKPGAAKPAPKSGVQGPP